MNLIQRCLMLICFFFHCGRSQNSIITCPETFYEEGNNVLSLQINTADFSVCDEAPRSVTCEWAPNAGAGRTICTQGVTSCDGNLTSRGCRCVETNGQGYKYQLAFSKSQDQDTGNISCFLDCVVYTPGASTATVRTDPTCQNIVFVSRCAEKKEECYPGSCHINEMDEPFCDCTGTIFGRPHCNHPFPDTSGLIAAASGSLILIVVLILLYCYWFDKSKIVFYDETKVLQTEEAKIGLTEKLKKETCCACSCSSFRVDFLRGPRGKRTGVILQSRNFFNLGNAYNQTKVFIQKMTTLRPGTDSYSPRQRKKKSDKEIQLSRMRGSSPPSETSGDENRQMISPTQKRDLPMPRNQQEITSAGIGSSALRRLEPVQNNSSKLPSVERNSDVIPRKLPTPRQEPLGPIPTGKTA